MAEFTAKGNLTLGDVIFYITAGNLEQAKRLAKIGEYRDYTTECACDGDVEIDVTSVEEDV